jgi:apolipoprotein N-acyltransferase
MRLSTKDTKSTKNQEKDQQQTEMSVPRRSSTPLLSSSSGLSCSSSRTSWLFAFLGSLLLWAALPPVDWWPLAWIAPLPWVLLIRHEQLSGRRPYAVLALAGFCFWMGALHWLRLPHPATSIGWVALSFYFAFYLPVFVGLSRVAVHRLRIPVILAAPIVWTGLELARSHLLTGMSMASLGHTQYRWVQLIQLSDLAGAYGVSFVVMFVAACLARMLPCDARRWTVWPLAPAVAVLAVALFYGHERMGMDSGQPGPRIALIQGSIDIRFGEPDPRSVQDRMFKEYFDLSRKAVEGDRRVELVVWPESMFPWPLLTFDPKAAKPSWYPRSEADFRNWLPQEAASGPSTMAQLAKQLGVPLMLGVGSFHLGVDRERGYNSAVYVGRDGKLVGRYDKIHLVMFGEYTPLVETCSWLRHFTPLTGNAAPGDKSVAFDVGRVRVTPSICYESVLSHVIRRQINALAAEGKAPDVLINLTNDGWFWGSSELDLHLACGAFRAVECRKPFLIAANTGFSAWIDGDGCIREQGPRRAQAVIVAQPRLDRRYSWYLAHGDWFAGVCLAVCGLCGLVGIYGRIRKTPAMDLDHSQS